jgi:nucleoside-diphosphate-sugar epimerase
MNIILISGGSGYLGSVLVGKLLQSELNLVTVVDNLMYGQTSLFGYASYPNFKFVKGDVRDNTLMHSLLRDKNIFIPLAAIVGAPACKYNIESSFINGSITGNIAPFPDILTIYPTTNSGYGAKTGELYCDETTPLNPISSYGQDKVYVEHWLLHHHPKTISLRLATVFGPSQRMRIDLLVNNFVYKAKTEGSLVLYEPHFKRNYVHIDDVCDCIIHCIKHQEKMIGQAYNVGLDEANLSKLELAQLVEKHIDCDIFFGEGHDPDKRNYIVSNKKLYNTGFGARHSIETGIKQLIKLYDMLPVGRYSNV